MRQGHDRRKFIGGAVGIGTIALFGCKTTAGRGGAEVASAAGDTAPRVRYAVTSEGGKKHLEAYKKAITLLQKGRTWNAQATIHNSFCTHNNWFFLPWHRFYLMAFEVVCRDALRKAGESDDFSIPYWSWPDTGRKIPDFAWGDGNPLHDKNRGMGPTDTFAEAACGGATLGKILKINNFMDFGGGRTNVQQGPAAAGQLEGTPHNTVHSTIDGDMGTFMSPLDPLFWLHHANVDRLWAQWQRQFPGVIPSNPSPKDKTAVVGGKTLDANFWLNFVLSGYEDPNGAKFTQVVADCLDTTKMKNPYTYDTLQAGSQFKGSTLALTLPTADALATAPTDRIYVESSVAALIIKIEQDARIITVNVPFSDEMTPYIQKVVQDPNGTGSLTLLVEQVPIPDNGLARHISLDFYANHPNLTASTDSNDPHFLSSYSFFSHSHAGAPSTVNLRIPLNNAFATMHAADGNVSALLLQVLVKDRRLKALPDLTFFNGMSLRLVYVES